MKRLFKQLDAMGVLYSVVDSGVCGIGRCSALVYFGENGEQPVIAKFTLVRGRILYFTFRKIEVPYYGVVFPRKKPTARDILLEIEKHIF